jgi:DNA-binding IscR family transcriptional regulator
VSFRVTQAVVDAWQGVGWTEVGITWRVLLWLARHADDTSQTVIRSQSRLADEFEVSERYVRRTLKYWRDRGVLSAIEHGGGASRKAA